MSKSGHPKAFISYSWDTDEHRDLVRDLAARLRQDGVDVTLDRWSVVAGDKLPQFMEKAVRENDFVAIVCTPNYKAKSDSRKGGVGYEGDIITAEMFAGKDARKFIPILRDGDFDTAIPTSIGGKAAIDLRGNPYSESEYRRLLDALHGIREEPPPIGKYPKPAPTTPTKTKPPRPSEPKQTKSGTWIMLGDNYFVADSVRHRTDKLIEVTVTTSDGESAAKLAALRGARHDSLPFAANMDAHLVRVQSVESVTTGSEQTWKLTLAIEDYNQAPMDINYNGIPADETARLRVRRVLLGELPPLNPSPQTYAPQNFYHSHLEGSSRFPMKECVVRSVFQAHQANKDWKAFARLRSIFVLKINKVVEHVFELDVGPVKNGSVAIKFRGERAARYSNQPATQINETGTCSLS